MNQPPAHGHDVFLAASRRAFEDLQPARGKRQNDVSQRTCFHKQPQKGKFGDRLRIACTSAIRSLSPNFPGGHLHAPYFNDGNTAYPETGRFVLNQITMSAWRSRSFSNIEEACPAPFNIVIWLSRFVERPTIFLIDAAALVSSSLAAPKIGILAAFFMNVSPSPSVPPDS